MKKNLTLSNIRVTRKSLYLAVAAASQLMLSTQVLAGPEGGQVVGGQGSIEQSGVNTQLAAYYRFQQNPEHTALKLGADLVNEILAVKSAAGTIGITTAAVGAALGITLTGGSVGASAAFASAAMAIGIGGTKLWEAWFPRSYNKIKGKF